MRMCTRRRRTAARVLCYMEVYRIVCMATTCGSVGLCGWETVPTHTYIHIAGASRSMVYTAADPGFACPRAESPKFPYFFWFSTSQNGAFHQIVKNMEIYLIKFFFFKGYESVIFCMRRARPEIRRPWTCSRPHTSTVGKENRLSTLIFRNLDPEIIASLCAW